MTRVIGLFLLAGGVVVPLLQGCQGSCAHAEDLCIECETKGLVDEQKIEDIEAACQQLFDGASSQFCRAAVDTYEIHCKDVP